MFTGLIQEVGKLTSRHDNPHGGCQIVIEGALRLASLGLGASVACNGICLTVVSCGYADEAKGWFQADLSPETMNCTTSRLWEIGTAINLETSLTAGDELGGHLVSGHVDGVGKILARQSIGDNLLLEFSYPPLLQGLIVRKGSVSVDGVSLTVNYADEEKFGVNLVPHTLLHTNLGGLAVGEAINLEADMLARYASKAVEAMMANRIISDKIR